MWPFSQGNSFKSSTKSNSGENPAIFNRFYVAAESGWIYNWQLASDRSANGNILLQNGNVMRMGLKMEKLNQKPVA